MYCKYLNDVLYIGLSICDEVGEVRDSRCCLLQASNIGVIQPRVLNDGLGWGRRREGRGTGGVHWPQFQFFFGVFVVKKTRRVPVDRLYNAECAEPGYSRVQGDATHMVDQLIDP